MQQKPFRFLLIPPPLPLLILIILIKGIFSDEGGLIRLGCWASKGWIYTPLGLGCLFPDSENLGFPLGGITHLL